MKKIIQVLYPVNLYAILLYFIMFPFSLFFKSKNIWLISEGINGAKDNGYSFYLYLKSINQNNVYFVLDNKSKDRNKIKKEDLVISKSLKHYFLTLIAQVHIETAVNAIYPNRFIGKALKRAKIFRGTTVLLQHGITKDYLITKSWKYTRADLLICGAKPEYDFIKSNYDYPPGNVVYTGLSRFDLLYDYEEKKQILLMPTWRKYLKEEGSKKYLVEFIEMFKNLFNSKQLRIILQKHGYRLVVYPHINLLDIFDEIVVDTSYITIMKSSDSITELIKSSKILITDYSSVFFDFAYMHKPIIHFHFDYEKYRMTQYKEGYFKYEESFGPVFNDVENMLDYLEFILSISCLTSNIYDERIDEYFPLHDQKNSERIYKSIKGKILKNETK